VSNAPKQLRDIIYDSSSSMNQDSITQWHSCVIMSAQSLPFQTSLKMGDFLALESCAVLQIHEVTSEVGCHLKGERNCFDTCTTSSGCTKDAEHIPVTYPGSGLVVLVLITRGLRMLIQHADQECERLQQLFKPHVLKSRPSRLQESQEKLCAFRKCSIDLPIVIGICDPVEGIVSDKHYKQTLHCFLLLYFRFFG
jgi:hypothetical protein